MGLTLFSFLGSVGFFPFEDDAFGIWRRIEGEGAVVEGRREVPGEGVAVLRPGVVGEGRDDELAWQRKLSELNPELPIDTFLVEGIVFAGDTVYCAGANVDCG